MTKSASSRTSIGGSVSDVRATRRISPMIEVTGPMWGTAPRGRVSRTTASFSATNCRLRYTSVDQSNST